MAEGTEHAKKTKPTRMGKTEDNFFKTDYRSVFGLLKQVGFSFGLDFTAGL
jgi:hypothetical protein